MFWNWLRARPIEELLGAPIDEVYPLGDKQLDEPDQGDGIPGDQPEAWRSVHLHAPRFGLPQIVVRYRVSDRRVWSVRLSNLGVARGFRIGGAKLPCDLQGLRRKLGDPQRSTQVTFVARAHWFERLPLLYIVEAGHELDDGAGRYATVVDLALAPREFDGGWRGANRTLYIRFPGSHSAFLAAFTEALQLTNVAEDRRSWIAVFGAARVSGVALNGLEQVRLPEGTDDAVVTRVREVAARLGTLL